MTKLFEDNPVFPTNTPTSIIQAEHTIHADFQRQRSNRAATARHQIKHINALLAKHNVQFSNYSSDLCSRLFGESESGEARPGGATPGGMSKWSEVILSLQDGSFVANTELGEIP